MHMQDICWCFAPITPASFVTSVHSWQVLAHISQHYLPALEAKATKDADLRAVGTRLMTYVTTQQYKKEPEGRALKKVDESSYTRA
jgi:hypothetical protein